MRAVVFPDPTVFDPGALRSRNRRLADYITDIAEQPLNFRGPYPIAHSAANHCHLWMIEAEADRDRAIDRAFRVAATGYILGRWRDRLGGYAPARRQGFRLYLYTDLAPTISVVAETPQGCPYGGDLTFVPTIGAVLDRYAGRSWIANFTGEGPSPDAVLKAADKARGALRASSEALGVPVAEIRRLIEAYGIGREVNVVRKRWGRRPAAFADQDRMLPKVTLWEWRVAPAP